MMKEFSFDDFMTRLNSYPALKEQAIKKRSDKGLDVFVQGDICKNVFCMQSGLLKLYYNTLNGKEWIKSFVADKGIIGSRSSQLLAKPSPFSVLCMEDTEILSYPY